MTEDRKKELLVKFSTDTEMVAVVKEILLAGIYENGVVKGGSEHKPLVNWAMSFIFNREEPLSNEALGEGIRAIGEGIQIVEAAFKKIEDYKITPPKEGNGNKNPGR